MNKNFTSLFYLICFIFFLSSCQDNNFRYLEPKNGKNCLLIKEYSYDGKRRYLLNEYSYLDTSRVSKITHYTPEGDQTESRFEYDQAGRLIRFYGLLTQPDALNPYSGYLDYRYDAQGRLIGIKGYNTEDGKVVLAQHMQFFYNDLNQIYRIVSSYGSETFVFYDEKGNVEKVFYDPFVGKSFIQEEYTTYNTQQKSNALNDILFLRDIFINPMGANYSQNRALNYKIFNEDGSLKKSYSKKYYYDIYGNYTKMTSQVSGAGTGSDNTIIEAEYKCR